jgi:hypothetical protein
LDLFEAEAPPAPLAPSAESPTAAAVKRKERKVGVKKTKPKKKSEGDGGEVVSHGVVESGGEVMKQLDLEFPDYLLDTPAPAPQSKPSPNRIRDLTRPTKASIASQAQSKPRVDEKDLGRKKKRAGVGVGAGVAAGKVKPSLPPKVSKSRPTEEKVSEGGVGEGPPPQSVSQKTEPPVETEEVYADEEFEEEPVPSLAPPLDTAADNSQSLLSPLLVPQPPPSTERSQPFPRKSNSSGSGSGHSPLLVSPQKPATASSPPEEPPVPTPVSLALAVSDEASELVISGIKLPTPAPPRHTEGGSPRDGFSPKTLRLHDSPRGGEGEEDGEETYEEDGFLDQGEGEDEINAFLQGFEEQSPQVAPPPLQDRERSVGVREGSPEEARAAEEAEAEESYNYDFTDPEEGGDGERSALEGQESLAHQEAQEGVEWEGAAREQGEENEEEVIGGDEAGEGEGEGSNYDYGEDSFAPYDSQEAVGEEEEGEKASAAQRENPLPGSEELSDVAPAVDEEDSRYSYYHDDDDFDEA